jgi:hypothetical protein
MKQTFIVLVLALIISNCSFAAVIDSNTVKTPSLTLAAIYGSNANYYGQTAEQRLPYLLTNASYRFKKGIYLSAGAYKLTNAGESSAVSELDLSAGYEVDFNKNFSGSFGYTRSVFAKNSPLLQAANENNLSASLTYDWKILKTNISSFYAFGTQRDVFISLNNSRSFDMGSLFSENDYISFEPGFEIVGGTLQYLEEYIVRYERQVQIPGAPRVPNNGENQYAISTRSATTFDMLSYSMNLLLGYNRSNYLIETGYQLSYLGGNILAANRKPRSFFNLSLYYQF